MSRSIMEISPPIEGNGPWLRGVVVQVGLFSGDPGLVYLWLSESALNRSPLMWPTSLRRTIRGRAVSL